MGCGLSSANPILGPPVRIERVWVKKAINKMKSVKAARPLGIVVQMLKASSGKTGIDFVTELENSIVSEGVVSVEWEVSSIINSYRWYLGMRKLLRLEAVTTCRWLKGL